MSALAAAAAPFDRFHYGSRRQPGYLRSVALAFAVHALLLAVLFFGVRFQSHAPQTVSVELWEPPAPQPRVVEPPPPPAPPKVEPEPPKPEPRIEKPDIVEKPAPKKPEPKKVEPPKPKPEPKKAEKKAEPKRDLEFERRMREQLAQEQAASQERQLKDMLAREQSAAQSRALATWLDMIRIKIRGNIPLQVVQQVQGNPEAIFDVSLLPDGSVLVARMRKSSGNAAYDDAVYRAILKSSPLPKPDQPSLFQRSLELRFRPQDK